MKDFITLGSTPYNEDCVQVSSDIPYLNEMKKECYRFKRGIENYFKKEIETGITLRVKTFQHDFGQYCEVVVFYDDSNDAQSDAAYRIEDKVPGTWEELEKDVNDNRETA